MQYLKYKVAITYHIPTELLAYKTKQRQSWVYLGMWRWKICTWISFERVSLENCSLPIFFSVPIVLRPFSFLELGSSDIASSRRNGFIACQHDFILGAY